MEKQNKPIEEAQNDFNNAQISVTKKAAKRLKAVMASEGKGDHYLRMSVDSGGCLCVVAVTWVGGDVSSGSSSSSA